MKESFSRVWIILTVIVVLLVFLFIIIVSEMSTNPESKTVQESIAHETEQWAWNDYALCMNTSLEEYIENEVNSDWRINYNRGILDHRIEQCATNNIPNDGWPNLKQHLPAYNECMDFYLEEYIEDKVNSEWRIDYNRGILDWQIEYCSKDPYMARTQSSNIMQI